MARELLATSKIHDIVRQVACDREVGIDEEAAKVPPATRSLAPITTHTHTHTHILARQQRRPTCRRS